MLFANRGYIRYASPLNATILHWPSGELHGDTLLRQVVRPACKHDIWYPCLLTALSAMTLKTKWQPAWHSVILVYWVTQLVLLSTMLVTCSSDTSVADASQVALISPDTRCHDREGRQWMCPAVQQL